MGHLVRPLLLAVAMSTMAGCGEGSASQPTRADEPTVLLTYDATKAGAVGGVGLGGRLGLDDRGCVTLGEAGVVVAPEGTVISPDGSQVTFDWPEGSTATFAVGDEVVTGGWQEVLSPGDAGPAEVASCRDVAKTQTFAWIYDAVRPPSALPPPALG